MQLIVSRQVQIEVDLLNLRLNALEIILCNIEPYDCCLIRVI